MKQTGLITPSPNPTDWIAGQESGIKKIVRLPDGNWNQFLPTPERQYKPYLFDTMSCVTFSGLNILEMFMRYYANILTENHKDFLRLFNFIDAAGNFNASDNFTAIMSGTTDRGNTFQNVLDSIRKDGVLAEKDAPFSGDNFEEYHDKRKITDYLKRRAKKFKEYFDVQYEWVMFSYNQDNSPEEGKQMEDSLKESPLHIGKPTPATHAEVLIAIKNGVSKTLFDSYEPYVQTIDWNLDPLHSAIKVVMIPKIEVPAFPAYEFKKPLSRGMKGADVTALQKILCYFGHMNVVNGEFGPVTQSALKEFQAYNGIDPLGIVGPMTREFLNKLKPMPKSNRTLLYETALKCLGTDVTPLDEVPDEVACAAGVNAVFKKTFGKEVGGGASTALLYEALKSHKGFQEVFDPQAGDIIISPTGYGSGALKNGHTGIMGENGKIMSNSSTNGWFVQNFTLAGWYTRYRDKGGFPVKFYRVL